MNLATLTERGTAPQTKRQMQKRRCFEAAQHQIQELRRMADTLRIQIARGQGNFRDELLRVAAWLQQQASMHPEPLESPRVVDARIEMIRQERGLVFVPPVEKVILYAEIYDHGTLIETKRFSDPRPAFIRRYNRNPDRVGLATLPRDGGLQFVDVDSKGGRG